MVSLGPLNRRRFCTYACAFCYVHADFASYPSMSPDKITEGLAKRAKDFDIVYVSGDTDSLAPGRTNKGLELIELLSTLGTDVLFTTRAPLSEMDLDRLASINARLKARGNLLFGCISISRLRSAPHIEPPPVPSPERRIKVLSGLKKRGIISVLAMRPFLPIIPVSEYVELARLATPHIDVILGEVWYADRGGLLEKMVFGEHAPSIETYLEHKMDFDDNDKMWKVWEGTEVRKAVASYCDAAGIPFFMRSRPAVLHFRDLLSKKPNLL
jgi:hypothetical protein